MITYAEGHSEEFKAFILDYFERHEAEAFEITIIRSGTFTSTIDKRGELERGQLIDRLNKWLMEALNRDGNTAFIENGALNVISGLSRHDSYIFTPVTGA